MSVKKKRIWITLLLFFISFITYLSTIAPTVSLWDCGEFIACSNIMGIPHPPGTPLYMIVGRFFIVAFGFLEDVALRVNVLSILTSAMGVSIVFLFIEKILNLVLGSRQFFYSAFGGIVGALLLTFSDTYWFNAVEAEVYGPAMLFVLLISWLGLLWFENKDQAKGNRYLILICYLSFLGIGFHLYSMMVVPVVFLLMLMGSKEMRTNIPLWITGILLFSVVYSIEKFIPIGLCTLIGCIILRFAISQESLKKKISLCCWFSVVALLGFSTYAYIPIRSEANPRIDENNPEIHNVFKKSDWESFNNFISRKQYTSTGMFERSIHRRGLLANQLLSHPHMGYGGYMLAQYLPFKVGSGATTKDGNSYKFTPRLNEEGVKRFGTRIPTQMEFMTPYTTGRYFQLLLFILFHIPMLWGVYYLYKNKEGNKNFKILAIYAFVLYFISSMGLLVYMNFADGTQIEVEQYKQWVQSGSSPEYKPGPVRMEVRERDYFYAPAYVFMSILFGISAGLFLYRRKMKNSKGKSKPIIALGLIIISAVVPCFSNYKEHSRANNYLAYDYAKNLLESCLPNSILFTNGDNDTFPLWFIQEAQKIRQDVRVINLSLANTNWYVEQLLTIEPKVNLGYTQEQTKSLTPKRNPLTQDKVLQLGSNIEIVIPSQQRKSYFKVQDLVLISLVKNNFPERPIHFVSSIGKSNMMGLERYTKHQGMIYTLTSEVLNGKVDVLRIEELLGFFAFRGLTKEEDIYYNGDNQIILYSYITTYRALLKGLSEQIAEARNSNATSAQTKADSLQRKGRYYIEKGMEHFYNNVYFFNIINDYYTSLQQFDALEEALSVALKSINDETLYYWQLNAYLKQNKQKETVEHIEKFEKKFPNSRFLGYFQQQKQKTLENL